MLGGETTRKVAHLAAGDEERQAIATTLRLDLCTAKFYRVTIGEDGEPDADGVDPLQAAFVAIVIDNEDRR